MRDELQATRDAYHTDIGDFIDKLEQKQPLMYHYPVSSQLLPVYHGNLGTILNLEDDELRKQVVVTRTDFVSLMDCFNTNNIRLRSWEEADARAQLGPDPDGSLAEEARRCEQTLADYAENIISYHNSFRTNHDKLQKLIERSIK